MQNPLVRTGKLATIFGGSGFVGRSVAKALAEHGWRVRIASRRPGRAFSAQPSGIVGQISAVQANLRYPESVARAVRDADAVINLVAILTETGPQTFSALHVDGARAVAEAVKAAGIKNLVHMSAIGADTSSPAQYGRTKGEAETIVHEIVPEAVIIRPSIIFGPEDKFFNRFAAMARLFPALPLIGGGHTRIQPVYVGDVAEAIACAVDGEAQNVKIKAGATYELGGPDVATMAELMRFILDTTGRKRLLAPIPFPTAELMGRGIGTVSALSFGFFPEMLVITRDQVEQLKLDNVVSEAAKRDGRTLEGLGIAPEAYQSFVPSYLYRFAKVGQYSRYQSG